MPKFPQSNGRGSRATCNPQPFSVVAELALDQSPCRIAPPCFPFRDVLGNNCACPDHCATPNGNSRQDYCSCADARSLLNNGPFPNQGRLARARMQVVRERRIWPAKYIIFENQPIPDVDATFERHAIPDDRPALNQRMGIKIAVPADPSSSKNHRKLPNPCPRTDLCSFVHNSMWIDIGVHADRPAHLQTALPTRHASACWNCGPIGRLSICLASRSATGKLPSPSPRSA